MSDETTTGAADAVPTTEGAPASPGPGRADEAVDADGSGGEGNANATGGGPAGPGPPRRRRRGSRGGRRRGGGGGRARPQGAGGDDQTAEAQPGTLAASVGDNAGGDGEVVDDDAADVLADRGLTSDDVAEKARAEAGLPAASSPSSARPQIGDRRPAPAPRPEGGGSAKPRIGDRRPASEAGGATPTDEGDGQGKRRRRRGGRGRGGSGGGGGGDGGGGGSRPEVVVADLGIDAPRSAEEELDALEAEVLQRRRGRTRKGRPAGRYLMCVHVSPVDGITQLAVLEGRSLVEHYLGAPTDDETSIDGNIYVGRVQNVLPGMEAAFIDFGPPKNGVLYRGDVTFDPADVDESRPRIERLLKNGQSIVVQVTKNPIGAKGARLTQEVSLAGRFVVMVPGQPDTYGISKRMPDEERRRLRRALDRLRPPDAGIIVRTAAEGATPEELERDVARLRSQWEQISDLATKGKPPRLLYQEPSMVVRVIREEFTREYRGVVIDDRDLYEQVRGYVEAIAPELAERIEYYDPEEEGLPVFERYHVAEQLLKALDRKVWLPSGGSIIIERTEALTVIDVNTGKNVGRSNLEETVYRNNLEAAEEIARQLRLRDIGGIIVIDFIDMEIRENREKVLAAFEAALARDKTRTQVLEISELGLVEMTRKRISEGLLESFSTVCETCHGRGIVLDETAMQEVAG